MLADLATLADSAAETVKAINMSMILSLGSSLLTGYFWLVKMNRERAGLQLYRVADFKPDRLQCSDMTNKEKATWYGELFFANPSTMPAAVVSFKVELMWKGHWLPGQLVIER